MAIELGEADEYRALVDQRLAHLVPVREPLVLVSQIQRSGGTLLSQLFDGHPECPRAPARAEDRLSGKCELAAARRRRPGRHVRDACSRRRSRHAPTRGLPQAGEGGRDGRRLRRLPVRVPAAPAEGDLRHEAAEAGDVSATCSTPTSPRISTPGSTTRTSIRGRRRRSRGSRRGWRWTGEPWTGSSPPTPMGSWSRSSATPAVVGVGVEVQPAALRGRRGRAPALARVDGGRRSTSAWSSVTYERLIGQTEAVMAGLAERVGIAMSSVLLQPTFNGRPIRANSAEQVASHGVLGERERPPPTRPSRSCGRPVRAGRAASV